MAQDKIKMNGTVIWQPDKDMGYSFETTYTEGSTRSPGRREGILPRCLP